MKRKTNFYHDEKKAKKISMEKSGKNKHNAKGEVVKYAEFSNTKPENPVVRVNQNRKWFANTRTITQNELQSFREQLAKNSSEPYRVLLKQKKLPMSLLEEPRKISSNTLVQIEPYSGVFGKAARRKKPRLLAATLEELSTEIQTKYAVPLPMAKIKEPSFVDPVFSKGKSKRIWGEFFKVLDSSDIILHVVDCRNPLGTFATAIEKYAETEGKHKSLVFVLNKCDLVPKTIVAKWLKYFARKRPSVAFHASTNSAFGKSTLISLLRQLSNLHPSRKQITVGLVGYPNVGKSSVINALRGKKVCTVAPIPGQTKVWQYVALTRKIHLIDCPGVVPAKNETETEKVLKGVVRITKIPDPEDHIAEVLKTAKKEHIQSLYKIQEWADAEDFLAKHATRSGKLLKGGVPDISTSARMILTDWLSGKIPFFVSPPEKRPALAENGPAEPICQEKIEST
ncbi:MAG: nucleolar GTP-binding protein 2 [Amphiamblys sp. WSBS2006]|nr:MAG: nucleolar GTP-binding protein 2 [Amphiamblys sp. WSBS2006]